MEDGKPDKGDTDGKDVVDDSKDVKEDPAKHFVSSPVIEAAKAENDRKEELIKEEKKLMDRREKLHAEQMVGGHTVAGQPEQDKKEETPHEYRIRIEKEMAAGKTDFKDGN